MSGAPPPPGTRVIVVDDDPQLRRLLRTTLGAQGYEVEEAATAAAAVTALAAPPRPALVLLDLGLPDDDGLRLLRQLPRAALPPVIVLSARDREGDKVAALDAGAEDYLTKPFGAGELLARIRVVLRRRGDASGPLRAGPIELDPGRHAVAVAGREVHLTPIEFKLLTELMRQPGRVLTHRQLLAAVWGPGAVEQTHYLRVHMAALRRKVEDDPARPRWLTTEPGVGYRLRGA